MLPRRQILNLLAIEIVACVLLAGVLAVMIYRSDADGELPAMAPTLNLEIAAASTAAAASPTAQTPSPTPAASATQATAAPSPSATPEPTARPTAQVLDWAAGLRLRSTPGTAGEVLFELPALATLTVMGRTSENAWLQVITAEGAQGWVSSDYVALAVDFSELEVTGAAEMAPVSSAGYLSGVSARARSIYLVGQSLGKRNFAFSLVGDSNTANPAFMAPFEVGQYDLGPYSDLALNVSYFAASFGRTSAAAHGGFNTAKVLDPAFADGRCAGGESPLACEYRLHQPSIALILLGTGDQHSWQGFEARYRQIIEYSIAQGVVPVLITKADDLESLENTAPPGYINGVIRRLAREYDVPLSDLRQAVESLPNRGCLPDGFHYNAPPDGQTASFNAGYLNYGFNMRNLTALEALDALRRYVLY